MLSMAVQLATASLNAVWGGSEGMGGVGPSQPLPPTVTRDSLLLPLLLSLLDNPSGWAHATAALQRFNSTNTKRISTPPTAKYSI